MSRLTKDDFKAFTYMGAKIKNTELQESACMEPGLREIIGYIKAFTKFSGDTYFETFVPALVVVARYLWQRMEVTDLSLLLGDNMVHATFSKSEIDEDSFDEDLEEAL